MDSNPSTPPERIRAARERAGLEPMEVAERLNLPQAHYWDLESFEDEAWMTLSLEELGALARLLGVTSRYILDGESPVGADKRMSFDEFAAVIRKAVDASGGDVDAWGETAGWDVAPILANSKAIWELNPDGLKDIADTAGVDWRLVLPEMPLS